MLSFLTYNPFAVQAFFERSLVLTYAVPAERLKPLLPACLSLDAPDDKTGLIAVAIVKTKDLRPKGFPVFLGNDFILIGYRIFVRYSTSAGKRLRGLYIIRSETDKRKMGFLGNIFTSYRYTTTDIEFSSEGNSVSIHSENSGVHITAEWGNEICGLPEGSPFKDWKEARRFSGPMPFTFSYNQATQTVTIIEGIRENWTPKPVSVSRSEVGMLGSMQLHEAVLASAFILQDIPYSWKKGRTDRWIKR